MSNGTQSTPPTAEEDEDGIDQFIELETSRHATNTPGKSIDEKQLRQQIRELGQQEKLKMKSNIFTYYEHQKKQRKITYVLFDAVMTILAAPATQVSVERAFSALALLLEDLRCKLLGSTIDNVLIVGLNSDLTNRVDFSSMSGTQKT